MGCMEDNYRAILDGSADAIYVTDMQYHLLYSNANAQEIGKRLFGNGCAGGTCYESLLGRKEPCPFCKMNALDNDEYLVRSFKSGNNHVFELRGKLIEWNGQQAHIEYIRDITVQEQALQQSVESTAQQQALYDHVGFGMCVYRYKDGELWPVACNASYRKLFTLPAGFDDGGPIKLELRNFRERNKGQFLHDAMEHIRTGTPGQLTCKTLDPETGLPRTVLMNADCTKLEDGSTMWYLTASDITEWAEKENQLNSVLSGINGGLAVYQIHKDGRIKRLMYTDGLLAMQGFPREEYERVGAQDSMENIYPEDRERVLQEIIDAARREEPVNTAYRVKTYHGNYIWVNLSGVPIGTDNEGCIRYNALLTNVSYQFELYQSLLDLSKNGVLVTDTETREVYFTNQIAKEIISSALVSCPNKDGCDLSTGCADRLCSDSLLLPGEEGRLRQIVIGGRVYQAAARRMQWMKRPAVAQYFSDITEEIHLKSELQNSEERYRVVVEQSGIALMDYDLLTHEVYMNERFKQYAASEVAGEHGYFLNFDDYSTAHPDDAEILHKFYDEVGKNRCGTATLRLKMRDGSYRWTQIGALEMFDAEGRPTRDIGFFMDVDAAKRQYEDLKVRYDYELTRLNSFEDGVVERMLLDLTDDKIIQAANPGNPNLARLEGLSMEQLLKARLAHTDAEDERAELRRFMDRENLLHAYQIMSTPSMTMQAPTRTGAMKYFRSTAQLAKNPGNGHIIAFIETIDVDKEKLQETMMQRLLENNYESAVVVSTDTGKIKIAYAAGDTDFTTDATIGYEMHYEEMMQKEVLNSVVPADREQVAQEMALESICAKLQTSQQCSGRAAQLATGADGVNAYKMWTATRFDSAGEYILITIANITEVYKQDLERARVLAQALKDAEAASRAKTTFLARMSHEIRTPITTVSGILELIRQDAIAHTTEDTTLINRVDTAATANQYLLTLINDILDISKIESNELTLAPAPANMRTVIPSIVAMIRPLAERKQLKLELERKTRNGDWYNMDSIRVSQILMNLLSNAVKFTPDGGTVHFTGETLYQEDGRAMIKFTVADTGVGISEEFKPYVFEPFRQEYTDSKSGYGGTGIGLAISRSLARLMGGDITFESEKGKGTTFTATMLLQAAAPQAENTPAAPGAALPLDGLRILLCEDNAVNQRIIRQLLERTGASVITADDGVQGVRIFGLSTPGEIDCVLMDIRMPNMDGLEATREIRALPHPDAKTVPILAMSANAYEEDRQLSLQAGMNEHLSKPINLKPLTEAIRKFCVK